MTTTKGTSVSPAVRELPNPAASERSLFLSATVACCRVDAKGRGMLGAARRCWVGVLLEALTVEEKSHLTVRLYNEHPPYYQYGDNSLHPWERTWFRRRLPTVPARILIGASGDGREAQALIDEGYDVDAFEPAEGLARLSSCRLGTRARVRQFRYEDLSAAVLDRAEGDDCFADQRYDAVLLGLGSLTHLVDRTEQERLFRALDVLCPEGPLLTSFWCAPVSRLRDLEPGRAARIGRAAGRLVARLRRIPPQISIRQTFSSHYGFAYSFTMEEIAELGARVGRAVVWEQDDTASPHATFLPRPGDGSAGR